MHSTIKNLINIQSQIKSKVTNLIKIKTAIVAVSKTFKIIILSEYGHKDFGKQVIAIDKWGDIKKISRLKITFD